MSRPIRLSVQPLEARDVPAGTLVIPGTSSADVVTIRPNPANPDVIQILSRADSGPVIVQNVPAPAVNRIVFKGHAGNDSCVNLTAKTLIAYGGAGRDTLIGGAGTDLLLGGDGQDVLRGNGGNDYLAGGAAADDMDGGIGNDWLLASPTGDIRAVNGRRVFIANGAAQVANGAGIIPIRYAWRDAVSTTGELFPVVPESAILTPTAARAILFPVFYGM